MDEHTRRAWAAVLAEQGLYAVADNVCAELSPHRDAAPAPSSPSCRPPPSSDPCPKLRGKKTRGARTAHRHFYGR
ncbi:hypothetical protein [Streptomyces atratus]|uniref:hypothetical protein n=1 Tax=Streptomyces atratus TaxID=1893 RepID=UPI001300754D|nr:hypothetical protein [Streptomyces atratus]